MLSNIKTLITALLTTAAFDAAVGSIQRVEVAPQLWQKGIDVSESQPNIDWKDVVKSGVSFVYIRATAGLGKCVGGFIVQDADVPL
jgi:GH25 family lysozyme M1 (1,4-beta-N-acetylmuramidase)